MSSFNARPHIDANALARLGLDQARLGRGVRLSPKEQRQRARRRSSRSRRAWEPGFGVGLYEEATRPAVDLGGFHLRACRSAGREVYRLACDSADVTVDVSGSVAPWSRDPDDATVLYIEPGPDVVYRISRPDGTGVVVVNEDGKGVFAYAFRPKTGMVNPGRIRGRTPVCPTSEWLSERDPDWLHELIRARTARTGMFSASVAVGVWMRLHEPDATARTATLDALLGGSVDPVVSQPLAWFEAVDPGHRRAALSGALSHTGALVEHLVMLRTSLDLEAPSWLDRLRSVLHIRDDLEGLRCLLLHTGDGEQLDNELATFDEEGRRFLRSMPRPVGLWDARLRRVAQLDPSAWWADPARERQRVAAGRV